MVVIDLAGPDDVAGWRSAARRLRLADVAPQRIVWAVGGQDRHLDAEPMPDAPAGAGFSAPKALLDLAENALLHRSDDRFDLMYRILFRLRDEPDLLKIITDRDVFRANAYRKAVCQANHKMHAFVRFRRIDEPESDATEEYAAWFEPAHYVLRKAADFFVHRLANTRFSIFTPYAAVFWDGQALSFGEGGSRALVPVADPQEAYWASYYASIFNPARLNPKVMIQHMAKRYWENLPEAAQIPELIAAAGARADRMVAAGPTAPPRRAAQLAARRTPSAIEDPARPKALAEIAGAIQDCRRCDLWTNATQAVQGEGPSNAALMLVGEQPGDQEDLRGRPFVGPAGELLDKALAEAGIDRGDCYVTNAVKHFKHELRGKRRLHKTPNTGEVKACRWWLEQERQALKPQVIVALGATAAAAVFGRPVSVMRERGAAMDLADGAQGFVTTHPAYLLRLPDEAARREAYADFVRDLKAAKALISPVHRP